MVLALISRLVVLFVGTLYPAYGSYKAIRSKNPREYVNWIMYWICFALFTFCETFSDIFLAFCVPFYYELKIVFLAWLLCPATKGSSILYRNFVHPHLVRHEQEIDDMISMAKENGVTAIYQLGSKGAQYASQLLASTAIRGQQALLQQLQRSYSHGDIRNSMPAILSSPTNGPVGSASISRSDVLNNNDPLMHEVRRREGSQASGRAPRRQIVSEPLPYSDEDDDDDLFMIDEEHMLLQDIQNLAPESDSTIHGDAQRSSALGAGVGTQNNRPPRLPAKKRGYNHVDGYQDFAELLTDDSNDETISIMKGLAKEAESDEEEMEGTDFVHNERLYSGVTRRDEVDSEWKPSVSSCRDSKTIKRSLNNSGTGSGITTRAAAKAKKNGKK